MSSPFVQMRITAKENWNLPKKFWGVDEVVNRNLKSSFQCVLFTLQSTQVERNGN